MRFPGKRKTKHYFPVAESGRLPFDTDFSRKENIYLVGIDQLLVDIEVEVDEAFLEKYGIIKGESCVLSNEVVEDIYQSLLKEDRIIGEYAGGAIGNTLHNYSILSDDKSVALGTICKNIHVGDYAFKYICTTSSKVDFSHLQPKEGNMARAMCFLTPDRERSFAIGKGIMNELDSEFIPEHIIKGASSLLISTYLLRDESSPLFKSTMKALKIAKDSNVPIIISLGTSSLVEEKREFFLDIIKDYVTILAMNEQEASALFGEDDPLLAGEKSLDYVDMTLLTVGKRGLYVCGYVDESMARETKDMIHTKSISEYNKYLKNTNKEDSAESQIDYVLDNIYEGIGYDIGAGNRKKLQKIFQSKDVKEITKAFHDIFERPAEGSLGKRQNAAEKIYQLLTDNFPNN